MSRVGTCGEERRMGDKRDGDGQDVDGDERVGGFVDDLGGMNCGRGIIGEGRKEGMVTGEG